MMSDETLHADSEQRPQGTGGQPAATPTAADRLRARRSHYDPDELRAIEEHMAYLGRRRWVTVGIGAALVACSLLFFQFMGRGTAISTMKTASMAEVDRIADANPTDRDIQLAAGKREIDDEHYHAARLRIEKLVRKYPNDFEVWFGMGRAAAMDGASLLAVEAYQRAIALNPKQELPHFLLAQTYFEAGLYTDSVAEFERLKALNPTYLDRDNQYGEALVRLGRIRDGFEQLKQVATLMPMQDGAYLPLTDAAIKLGRQQEVEALILSRLEVSTTYPYSEVRSSYARLVLSEPLTSQRLKSAEEQARAALKDRFPSAFATYSRVLKAEGRWPEALKAAKDGLGRDPKNRECLEMVVEAGSHAGDQAAVASARDKLGELDREEQDVKQLDARVKANPADRQAYLSLAEALDKKGRSAMAAETLQRLVDVQKGDPGVATQLEAYRQRAIAELERQKEHPIFRPQYNPEG